MDFFRVTLALATVFGLLGLLYLVSKRVNGRIIACAGGRGIWRGKFPISTKHQGSSYLQVIRRVNLNATHQVHLVSTLQQTFVICTHPHGCTLLAAHDAHAPTSHSSAAPEALERYAS